MRYPDSHYRRLIARQRAFSLVELLVVVAISSLLMIPLVAVSISLQHVHKQNRAKIEALGSARGAMETLCADLKNVYTSPQMVGFGPTDLPNGDRIDNNQRTTAGVSIDEQLATTGPTDATYVVGNDRHALLSPLAWWSVLYERRHRLNLPDLGDLNVEDDTRFSSTTLSFRINPPVPVPPAVTTVTFQTVNYTFVTGWADIAGIVWNGTDWVFTTPPPRDGGVLMRTVTYTYNNGSTSFPPISEPIAFDVLSFNCLYWDANHLAPANQYWVTSWDYTSPPGDGTFSTPSTVYLEIVVYADEKPLSTYQPGLPGPPIQTITLRTAVNIETVLSAMPRDP